MNKRVCGYSILFLASLTAGCADPVDPTNSLRATLHLEVVNGFTSFDFRADSVRPVCYQGLRITNTGSVTAVLDSVEFRSILPGKIAAVDTILGGGETTTLGHGLGAVPAPDGAEIVVRFVAAGRPGDASIRATCPGQAYSTLDPSTGSLSMRVERLDSIHEKHTIVNIGSAEAQIVGFRDVFADGSGYWSGAGHLGVLAPGDSVVRTWSWTLGETRRRPQVAGVAYVVRGRFGYDAAVGK